MQIIPVLPQQKNALEENLEVSGIAAVKPAKAAEERTLPPLINHGHEPPVVPLDISNHATPGRYVEQRMATQIESRRVVCRRIRQQQILEELRSLVDRRRHKRRLTDSVSHIDEQA